MTVTETAELPPLVEHRLIDKEGEFVVTARQLASASSWKPRKLRWFEVALYKTGDGRYVVHTVGRSTVAGDITRARVVLTPSAFEVIELLTVHNRGETYIPQDSIRALAQAAQWDDDLKARYLEAILP